MPGAPNDLVLYHYSFSPYARKVLWYLSLRSINYAQVPQPPILPRPDLTTLGVHYRRIPVMAIGKDIFCDTRLILSKLETLFPASPLGFTDPSQHATQQLLEKWAIEGGVFNNAAALLPTDMPIMKDPKFTKDRESFSGRSWGEEQMKANRPVAVAYMRDACRFLEEGLLADGREWIMNTPKPSLADIDAVWPFHWLNGMPGALPADQISAQHFPKLFSWIARFDKAVNAAKKAAPKPVTLKGPDAALGITAIASFLDKNLIVDEKDPLGLKAGATVDVFPTDSGFGHKDSGKLVLLNEREVAIEVVAENGEVVRLHFPRIGFRIKAVSGKGKL